MKKLLMLSLLLTPALAVAEPHHDFHEGHHHYVQSVHVGIAPPPMRVEYAPPSPSPRHQWVAGYWGWQNNAHVWIDGRWLLPPAPNYVWEPARWENENGQWEFFDGHWRPVDDPDATAAYQPPPPPVQEVVVEQAPPQPIVEVQPVMPFANAFWIPGYWNWNGFRHVWVTGRWTPRPAGFAWEPARWERRPDGHYVQHVGHWRH